jgi:hypothetical protein
MRSFIIPNSHIPPTDYPGKLISHKLSIIAGLLCLEQTCVLCITASFARFRSRYYPVLSLTFITTLTWTTLALSAPPSSDLLHVNYSVTWCLKAGIVSQSRRPLLDNGSVNTIPRQWIRKQQSKNCSLYAVPLLNRGIVRKRCILLGTTRQVFKTGWIRREGVSWDGNRRWWRSVLHSGLWSVLTICKSEQ